MAAAPEHKPAALRENDRFLQAVEEASQRGKASVLATIVHTWGSTYRRPGARMVVTEDGTTLGTVSGGCLEGDLAEIAREVMESGRPLVVRYDLTEDAVWGLGLGCGGGVDVLLEPVPPRAAGVAPLGALPAGAEPADQIVAAMASLRDGRACAVVTVISPPGGGEPTGFGRQGAVALPRLQRAVVSGDTVNGGLGDEALTERACAEARRRLGDPAARSGSYKLDDGVRVFIDLLKPPPTLLILGAGHDAIPVSRLAAEAGLRVVVCDPRPAFARPERFPLADQVMVAEPGDTPGLVELSAQDYVLVMHHNKARDREALAAWLATDVGYIGMLGPRSRTLDLLNEIGASAGGAGAEERSMPERVFAPVGLDIGGETPEQIAVSIVAEVLAHHNRRSGGHLRDRSGRIH